MRAGEVSAALAAQVDSVAAYLLPNGRRIGRDWCADSVHGEAGESLKVALSGSKAGRWKARLPPGKRAQRCWHGAALSPR